MAAPLALMLVFTLVRLALFLTNHGLFAALPVGEIMRAFGQGLRFDFYMTGLCMGPVILLLNIPVPSKIWTKIWTGMLLIEWTLVTGFLIGDLIYFPKVDRHIAEEIIQLSSDWGYIVSYAVTQVWWGLLILLGSLGWGLNKLCRVINRYPTPSLPWKKTGIVLGCIALFTVAALRGHLGRGKSLGVADVYNYAQTSQGAALTLNGAFTAYQVGRKGAQDFTNDYPLEEAIQNTQELLIAADEQVVSPQYPLMRQQTTQAKSTADPANILIVLLEGWHPYYIDALSHQNFGVTPVFDEIVQNGLNFTQAYAAGQRSIFGFAAVLASVPLVPGLPMFGYGLEMASLSAAPKHFAKAGYYTFFAQTSHRDSYRLCALASYLGMQDSFGWEDIPQRLPYRQKAPFGYDHDAFQFAADQITKHKDQPFMGMVFTGITHEPFTSTLPQFDKFPYDAWEHGFLNTLGFADWSIGQLLERAKQDGWFDKTIFIFVADHTSGGPADTTLQNHFKIPLIIYAPQRYAPQTITDVVSQLDLVPTLYDIAGLRPVYTAFGRSVFDQSVAHAALVSEGNNIGIITKDGAVRHSGSKLLTVEPYNAGFDVSVAEQLLLSLDKTAYTLLKENRWYNPVQESAQR